MKNKHFKFLEDSNPNYVAYFCKIKELHPIEGADALVKTVVMGYDIVVSNTTQVGDEVIYFPTESSINMNFLGVNNLFEISELERNLNASVTKPLYEKAMVLKEKGLMEDYEKLIKDIKLNCGFFGKHGRVKCLTLRGCPSQGFVIPIASLLKWKPELNLDNINFDEPFNEVDEEVFVKKYVPIIKESQKKDGNSKKNSKLKRFNRIRPEQFSFHYDTNMLNVNMKMFKPETKIVITRKLHGTSGIFSKILCNRKLSGWEKFKKFFGAKVLMTEYGAVYASRSVIKNQYINPNVGSYYSEDVWGFVNELIYPYLDNDMTVYGEIVGYVPNTNKYIQKNHDFSCEVGKCKFMPYRITINDEFGNKTEWTVREVENWTFNLIMEHPELRGILMPIDIVFEGYFGDLYPEILPNEHWNENVLAKMKLDPTFYMELDEPLCKMFKDDINLAKTKLEKAKTESNKKEIKSLEKEIEKLKKLIPPAEGIVVRTIDPDLILGANKLKTQRHYEYEKNMIDAGEVDMETVESEGGEE